MLLHRAEKWFSEREAIEEVKVWRNEEDVFGGLWVLYAGDEARMVQAVNSVVILKGQTCSQGHYCEPEA